MLYPFYKEFSGTGGTSIEEEDKIICDVIAMEVPNVVFKLPANDSFYVP